MINLTHLLSNHKEKFRQKFVEALAKKNELTIEEVEAELKDTIEQYIGEKYRTVQDLVDRINEVQRPVLLNIRRDREREDKCKLCDENQPNIDEISVKYGDKIELIELFEDKPEGGALYHIIFHEESDEKKLPLTAVISRGEILKFWAGKTVEPAVYEIFLRRIIS
jgi:BMFP domain-containing protein YqiC